MYIVAQINKTRKASNATFFAKYTGLSLPTDCSIQQGNLQEDKNNKIVEYKKATNKGWRNQSSPLKIWYAVNKEKEFFIFREKTAIPNTQKLRKIRKWSNMWSSLIFTAVFGKEKSLEPFSFKAFSVVEATGLEAYQGILNPFIYKASSVCSPIVHQTFSLDLIFE